MPQQEKSIAILTPIPDLGGAEISILELASRLRDEYQFHFIVPGEGPLKREAEYVGASTWMLNWPKALKTLGETGNGKLIVPLLAGASALPLFTRELSKLLRRIRPAMLITNAIKCHLVGALASRTEQTSLVWYMRDGMEQRGISRSALRLLNTRCDAAICISHYTAEQVRRYISPTLPLSIIYNIVDLALFQPGLPVPEDLVKGSGEVWFGNIGVITPLKGQDLFLQAAEIVSKELPQARFLIVGSSLYATHKSSDFERALRCQADSASLRGKVLFLGFRNDVPQIVSNLDVFVQSNRGPEGLGRSILEAMASSVPSVVVDRWGPAELITHGTTGLTFPQGNVQAMASKMLELGKDSLLRQRLGGNARVWVEHNLVPETLAQQADQCFLRILQYKAFSCQN